jgi:hypothetical protein
MKEGHDSSKGEVQIGANEYGRISRGWRSFEEKIFQQDKNGIRIDSCQLFGELAVM